MSGAITGDGERTEEEKEGDPPHPRFPPTFSRCCAYVAELLCHQLSTFPDTITRSRGPIYKISYGSLTIISRLTIKLMKVLRSTISCLKITSNQTKTEKP